MAELPLRPFVASLRLYTSNFKVEIQIWNSKFETATRKVCLCRSEIGKVNSMNFASKGQRSSRIAKWRRLLRIEMKHLNELRTWTRKPKASQCFWRIDSIESVRLKFQFESAERLAWIAIHSYRRSRTSRWFEWQTQHAVVIVGYDLWPIDGSFKPNASILNYDL